MTTITAALVTVTSTDDSTHLAASSPYIHDTHPDVPPAATLCRQPVEGVVVGVQAYDVDCGNCILLSGPYLELPGWQR